MFNPLKEFVCADIEKIFGVPQELTSLFLDGKCTILPYPIIKVYQKYFRTPSFNELLDEYKLAEYLLDEDAEVVPMNEDEIRVRDNSMYDMGIHKGDIVKYTPFHFEKTGFHIIELDGIPFMAYIKEHNPDGIRLRFFHDDFKEITIKSDKLKIIGYAEIFRKPNGTAYYEIIC